MYLLSNNSVVCTGYGLFNLLSLLGKIDKKITIFNIKNGISNKLYKNVKKILIHRVWHDNIYNKRNDTIYHYKYIIRFY